MIVSAVADPTAFGPLGIKDELSKREAIAFLQGIIENGVLLDEPSRGLLREALGEVSKLTSKLGQRIQGILLEIQQNHKKYVVACDRLRWQQCNPSTLPAKCTVLATNLSADAIITQADNFTPIQTAVGSEVEVVLVSEASESHFESTRQTVRQLNKPLDSLDAATVDELVGRALKYATVIRFFDYRMVASEKHADRYRAGIQFFVTIWDRWCVVGEATSRTVELYTLGNTVTQSGFLSGAEADVRLAALIQEPLKSVVRSTILRFVKQDREPAIFHTRGLEARQRAYTIDPGFDAVDLSGPVRRCLLSSPFRYSLFARGR